MRDACRDLIFSTRPNVTTSQAVAFCLQKLIDDSVHVIDDELSPGLSYRDLLGALVLATDVIDELEAGDEEINELERDLSNFQDEVSTLEDELTTAENTITGLEAAIEDY